MFERTVLLDPHVKKDPWFVRLHLSPEEARRRLMNRGPRWASSFSRKDWDAFLERKRFGTLKRDRGANTTLKCPGCGQFLRHFYITRDRDVFEQAKTDRRVHDYVSGYVCWGPCFRTFFLSNGRLE